MRSLSRYVGNSFSQSHSHKIKSVKLRIIYTHRKHEASFRRCCSSSHALRCPHQHCLRQTQRGKKQVVLWLLLRSPSSPSLPDSLYRFTISQPKVIEVQQEEGFLDQALNYLYGVEADVEILARKKAKDDDSAPVTKPAKAPKEVS